MWLNSRPIAVQTVAFRWRHAHSRHRGFNLIEAALVTVIVGTGFLAMLGLVTTGTSNNAQASELTTAINLAQNIREMTMRMRFTDQPASGSPTWGLDGGETYFTCGAVDDLDGAAYSPPVDSTRAQIANMNDWRQVIDVQTVFENNVTSAKPSPNLSTDKVARVTVSIEHRGRVVYTEDWLVVNTD